MLTTMPGFAARQGRILAFPLWHSLRERASNSRYAHSGYTFIDKEVLQEFRIDFHCLLLSLPYSTIADFSTSVYTGITDSKQDGRLAYDVTLRHSSVTTVAVGKSDNHYIFCVCVCSLGYPPSNAHVS
jgi:hypothetical protein